MTPGLGPHLECAAGVGSLALTVARQGRRVVAADTSLRSLRVVQHRVQAAGLEGHVLPVVADITGLPFVDGTFASATSAETLEHIPDDGAAAAELARVVSVGGCLVGTVPAGPEQWSDWDDWAGHVRRYTAEQMRRLLTEAGLEASAARWGWPVLRLYDGLFLRRVNRRRLTCDGSVEDDAKLRTVASLGRRRLLVRAVMFAFACDRLFDGARWGVGVLFAARKPDTSSRGRVGRERSTECSDRATMLAKN